MSRSPRIRITKNDKQEYARLVRNAKSKISRIKTNYEIDLANDIKLPKLEDISTREEYNKIKREIKSFTSRSNQNYQFVKNDYGVVATKKEINEVKRNTKAAQRIADRVKKEIEKKPFHIGGKQQTTVGQRMAQMARPDVGISRPNDFDFDAIRSRHDFKRKMESMEDRADPNIFEKRKQALKENIIKKMEVSFNSDADELIKRLKTLDADVMYELFLTHEEFQFTYRYTRDHMGVDDINEEINDLHSILDRFDNGEENTDLWGF